MASGETICQSYECLPLLGFFLCVKNAEPCWRLVQLGQSFSDIFHNFVTWQKMAKSIVKIAPDINEYVKNVFTIQTIQYIAKF